MKIEIPFNDWSKDKLLRRKKFATSRNKIYGKIGDTFEVKMINGKTIEYELLAVVPMWLEDVAEYMYHMEGAENRDEFELVWKEIHPRKGFQAENSIWFHIFQEL